MIGRVGCLNCYECSNLSDDKCGTTFGYARGSQEAKKVLKKCPRESIACRKIEHEDSLQGRTTGGVVVTRSCYKPPNYAEGYRPENACSEVFRGSVCYCGNELCNGKQLLRASAVMCSSVLLPFILKFLIW
ncbi:hypothetical protein ACF0H5_011836 [Mactra antiquata]